MVTKKATESDPEPKVTFDPKSPTFKVETANSIYELKKPTGKLGALHFRLLTKGMPKSTLEENGQQVISPADQERMQEVYEQWVDQVLPNIILSCDYEDLPGEDQWVLYLACYNTINVRSDLFRLIA